MKIVNKLSIIMLICLSISSCVEKPTADTTLEYYKQKVENKFNEITLEEFYDLSNEKLQNNNYKYAAFEITFDEELDYDFINVPTNKIKGVCTFNKYTFYADQRKTFDNFTFIKDKDINVGIWLNSSATTNDKEDDFYNKIKERLNSEINQYQLKNKYNGSTLNFYEKPYAIESAGKITYTDFMLPNTAEIYIINQFANVKFTYFNEDTFRKYNNNIDKNDLLNYMFLLTYENIKNQDKTLNFTATAKGNLGYKKIEPGMSVEYYQEVEFSGKTNYKINPTTKSLQINTDNIIFNKGEQQYAENLLNFICSNNFINPLNYFYWYDKGSNDKTLTHNYNLKKDSIEINVNIKNLTNDLFVVKSVYDRQGYPISFEINNKILDFSVTLNYK